MSHSKNVSFENIDYYHELRLNISYYRRCLGYTQAMLAEKAGISTSHLSALESPNNVKVCSLEVIFNIARSLGIHPYQLFKPLSTE